MTLAPSLPSIAPVDLACSHCGCLQEAASIAACPECFGPLEPRYDPLRSLPDRDELDRRGPSLWRYREWLPFVGTPVYSLDTGGTPLIEAPALARRFGVARVLIKNDAVSHPSLSFKDRVVATAINAAHGLRCEVIACASTGNLANAVASHAALAGLPALVLVPEGLESSKLRASIVHGARVIRIRGTYDDVNRLCVQLADRFGWGFANVNLRPYYAEGSKTVAFEIAQQLRWRLPSAVVVPMAGGALLSKLFKGFTEFRDAGLVEGSLPRLVGAQATGCSPIVAAFERGTTEVDPVVPDTIARSLAIGNPADGGRAVAAIRSTGGTAASVTDREIVAGVRLLADTTGIFAESAGGVTTAVADKLAASGAFDSGDEIVLAITAHGLKTPNLVELRPQEIPIARPRFREVADLIETTFTAR